MNKAVIYARYSSDSQTEQSVEGQMRVCKEYAEKNGYFVVGEYIDRAMTGTNDKRPAFQQMIGDSKKHEWSFVLVYKFDRFARSRYDSAINKSILKKNGVKVVSATEQISNTPEGIILEGMLESFAEYYSAELSQKVKRGLKESRIKGFFTGGPTPYGYDKINQKLVINETEANIVRQMFNDYLSGMRIKDIVIKLLNAGIKNKYGTEWNINSISRILRNENYKGILTADNTIYTNIYPQIVSEEIFDEVNNKLKIGKRTSAHYKTDTQYLLSGKLLCGKCGGLMTGDSGKGKLGKIYNYYKCFTKKRNKEKCDKKSISKEYIEDIVFTATQNFFMQIDLKALAKKITEIYNKSIEENHELKALEKELADINKKLKNLLSAIENGIFNDTTNQRMKELEISKKELEEKIAQTSAKSIQPFNEEQIYTYLLSFKDIDQNNTKAKQKLIDMFINKIVLFDDHVEIYFNASDDKKTHLKLKEMPEDGELFDSCVNKKQPETAKVSDCLHLAERAGFEPALRLTRTSTLAGCPLRPLEYLSITLFGCLTAYSNL